MKTSHDKNAIDQEGPNFARMNNKEWEDWIEAWESFKRANNEEIPRTRED